MGAGDFDAGLGDAGEDPVDAGSPTVAHTPPAAPYLDLGLMNYRLDANGVTQSMHPNDQAAQWSFAIRKGTHKADPNVGHTFFDAPPLSGAAKQKDFEQRALAAYPFSRMIAKGLIAFEGVTVTDPKFGETGIAVHYRNLQLDPTLIRTASVSS